MKLKTTAVLLLAATLLSTTLASCSGDSATDVQTSAENAETTTVETTSEKSWTDALPADADFEGEEVVIISRPDNDTELCYTEIGGVEANGDVLNDEFYTRNRAIEDKLNVKITQFMGYAWNEYSGKEIPRLRTSIAAGDNAWQIVSGWSSQVTQLSLENCFMNLLTLENIDTAQPWWNQSAVEGLQIGGGLYFLAGDICVLSMLGGTWVPYINDRLAIQYGIEDLSQVVLDGGWTVDKMVATVKNAKNDLNGDGVMDDKDMWGLVTTQPNPSDMFYFGADIHQVFIEDGLPVFVPAEEKVTSLYEKIYPLFYGKEDAGSYMDVSNTELVTDKFIAGEALMIITHIGASQMALRDMDDDFTVLPAPKFDDMQDDYYSYSTNGISVYGIPTDNPNPETAAAVMEAMGAYNYDSLTELYFKLVLQDKFARHENSVKMLEIIKDGVYLDCENLYRNILGGSCYTMRRLLENEGTGVASWYATNIPTIEGKIAEAVETLSGLNK